MSCGAFVACPLTALIIDTASADEIAANSRPTTVPKIAPRSLPSDAPSDKLPKVRVTLGKQTTYILGPLRDDGYPDYFAALNRHASAGITHATNAVIPLIEAFGPEAIDEPVRRAYLEQLGLESLPARGLYFVPSEEMVERWLAGEPDFPDRVDESELRGQFDLAVSEPWLPADYPIVAEWLALNAHPLRQFVEAAHRDHFFDPAVPHNPRRAALVAVQYPAVGFVDTAVRALQARSMLHLATGNIDQAWADLHACHRLSRLAMSTWLPSYSDQSTSLATWICHWQIELLHRARPNDALLRRVRREMLDLPQLPTLADRIDVGERYRMLDTFCVLARDGSDAMQYVFSDLAVPTEEESLRKALSDAWFDWNEPLKMANQWYDRFVAAHRIDDPIRRQTELAQLTTELEKLGEQSANPGMFAMNWFTKGSARAAMGRMIGANFIQWLSYSAQSESQTREQYHQHLEFLRAALVLAEYRAAHGLYPDSWDNLPADAQANLPRDLYALGEPPRYRREGHGYTIYSIGPNGLDDMAMPPATVSDWLDADCDSSDDIYLTLDSTTAETGGAPAHR